MATREKSLAKAVLAPLAMMLFLASIVGVTVPVQACPPKVFTVSPSGVDDTAAIQAAFDAAVAAGPGSTVKLTAGQFYSTDIFVENFRGTFTGAGRDLTVIDTLRGLDPSLPGISVGADGYPVFFSFENGDVRICDMTFDITAHDPAEPWVWPWAVFGIPPTTATDVIRILGNTNSRIERVRFVGHEGTFDDGGEFWNVESTLVVIGETGYSPETGVTGGPISGSHTVSECAFEYVDTSIRMSYLMNGKATITRTSFSHTTAGAFFYDFVNSLAEVAYNQIAANAIAPTTTAGVVCIQGLVAANIGLDAYPGPLPANMLLLVHHNSFRATGYSDAVDVYDFMPLMVGVTSETGDAWGAKSVNVIVSDNDISLENTGVGIFGQGVNDFKAINNRLTGISWGGIGLLDLAPCPCTGDLVLANTFTDFAPAVADVWLWGVSHCLVVARPGTTVLDWGTDNRIIGGILL